MYPCNFWFSVFSTSLGKLIFASTAALPRLFYWCFFYIWFSKYQVHTGLWPNVGLMLGQRRIRWTNINPTLGQSLLFAGHLIKGICWQFEYRYQNMQDSELGPNIIFIEEVISCTESFYIHAQSELNQKITSFSNLVIVTIYTDLIWIHFKNCSPHFAIAHFH